MPDDVLAQDKGSSFTPHDEGQFAAVCVDVIALGHRVEQFPGKPSRVVPKCALVFLTNTTGETKEIAAEVTVSMGEKANLRKLLEDWRGKSYTPEQAEQGVPLAKLVGHPALLTVEQKRSGKGRTYARIKTLTPLPQGMSAPSMDGYKRQEFWATRKKEYAEEAARFMQVTAQDQAEDVADDDLDPPPF
jgi:hypothetical protein